MKKVYSIPSNTRDLMFSECESRRGIERRVMKLFSEYGYDEIVTPTLEYYDLFASDGSFGDAEMFKLTDSKNRLVVLRPDSTVPIGRIISAKLGGTPYPIRLCYDQNVFRANSIMRGKRDEITECGVELIGARGMRADTEVLSLAASALRRAVGRDFKLELGSAAYTDAVLASIPESERREIRSLIADKNFTALSSALEKHGSAADDIKKLPGRFGTPEVIDEALAGAAGAARDALLYLKELCGKLASLGFGGHVIVDLGMISRLGYYTGVIFRGYIEEMGMAVLSGGAYGRLFEDADGYIPSVGFSLNADAANDALCAAGAKKSADAVIFYADGDEAAAFSLADRLRSDGRRVELSVCDTAEQTVGYAEKAGIPEVYGVEGGKVKKLAEINTKTEDRV